LIEIRAFGLNSADIFARRGKYQEAPPFPFIPGYEVAGDVVEVGEEVTRFKKGQKVMAVVDFGGYAQYAKAREEATLEIPDSWSYSKGASILVVFVTAYHSLFHTGLLLPGDRVLIHACAGGLGQAALQLALHAKCEVFGTCGSDGKIQLLKEKGVHHPINYKTQDFDAEVKRITNGEGVDIILDAVGGSTFKKDMSILRANGRLIGLGAASTVDRSIGKTISLIGDVVSMLTISSIDLMIGSKAFIGVNLKQLADHKTKIFLKALIGVMELFEKGAVKVEEPMEIPWEEIGNAHKLLESRKTTGKLVMLVTDNSDNPKVEEPEDPEEF